MKTATRSRLAVEGVPLLRMKEEHVTTALACSRSHLWAKISTGEYPPPDKTDVGNRWDSATLLAWYEAGCPKFADWYPSWEGRR
jgi:predicted DNA-binding transcriptional regulator AlpA